MFIHFYFFIRDAKIGSFLVIQKKNALKPLRIQGLKGIEITN